MTDCTHCGSELPEDAFFCTACGAAVLHASVAGATAPENAPPSSHIPSPLPTNNGLTFRNSGIGLVLTGMLLIAVHIFAFSSSPMFAHFTNIVNLFRQFAVASAIGFAVVLSMRAKGPDLSVGSVMGLSAVIISSIGLSTGSVWIGLLVALVVSAVIGLINGVFSVYFRVPAVIITIITGALAYSISLLLSQGKYITGSYPSLEDVPAASLLLIIITFIIAFLLVLLTPLGLPKHKREKNLRPVSFMFAYVASAINAVFAGFFLVLRLHGAQAGLGTGYEVNVLFIFAVVYSSRVLDNRVAPVIFSVIPAWILCVLTNTIMLLSYPMYVQSLIGGALALVFGILAYICRHEKQNAMLSLMSN